MRRPPKQLNSLIATKVAAVALLLCAPFALAHDEDIHCTLDMMIDRDKVTAELHFPIQALLESDARQLKEVDRDAYVKSKAAMLVKGLHITFDNVPLVGKVTQISAADLAIAVSPEDNQPRPAAVCRMEFTLEKHAPPPKLVTVDHDFLPPAKEGREIDVVCVINRKQVGGKALLPISITNDDRMTMRLDWTSTTQPATAPARTQVIPDSTKGFTAETQRRGEPSIVEKPLRVSVSPW
jgi:hypothetical protein